jgi:N4-(beta-N-acetylglucosaminyl)-L-asparaginase
MKRREFVAAGSVLAVGAALPDSLQGAGNVRPIILSTWHFGAPANEDAWKLLQTDASVLDAVEAGVRVPEADPKVNSVGYGGLPDREGNVTLDACIMNGDGRCGSVTFLEHIKHPVSVARAVMEKTDHIMLSGSGALQFALQQGFEKEELLTPESAARWKKWLEKTGNNPVPDGENHDTIGMIAMDKNKLFAGACTTSGLAFKMRGRVGDSPIIGSGLFVENGVGAATATGVGEEVIRIAGAAVVVEMMRAGRSPQKAVEEAIKRIARNTGERGRTMQLGMLAIDRKGRFGAYGISPGFQYALTLNGVTQVVNSASLYA